MAGRIQKRFWAVLLCVIFLFTACGPEESVPESGDGENKEVLVEEVPEVIVEEAKEPYDLLTQRWVAPGELQNPKHWWQVEAFVDDLVELPEGRKSSWRYTAADGSRFYVVSFLPIYDEKDPTVWVKSDFYLTCFDADTMKSEGAFLDVSAFGEGITIDGIVAAGGQLMIFLQELEGEERVTTHYYAGLLKEDGTIGECIDLLPAIEECGNMPEPKRAFERMEWDSGGYFFCWDEDYNRVHVIDSAGDILDCMEVRTGYNLSINCISPDGHLIWEESSWEEDTLSFFYYGAEGRTSLYTGPFFYVENCLMNPYGELYFPSNGALVRWDASDGTYERLIMAAGMDGKMYDAVLQNEKGHIVFVDYENQNFCASVYSLNGPAKKTKLTLVSTGVCDFVTRTYVTEFMRMHPGVKIEIKESKGRMEESDWTKLLAELTAGKGPELLLLTGEEMRILQEKGVLADLSGVLSPEVEANIFDGVLDCGKVGETLYAMTYQASFDTLMVSKDIWQEKTWTIEEVLRILEELEEKGTPVESFCSSVWHDGGVTGDIMFRMLIYDIANSSFLDIEKGTCSFETEAFYRLLEMCKKYEAKNSKALYHIDSQVRWDEVRMEAQAGKYLAFDGTEMDYSPEHFSETLESMENYYFVGYPTNGSGGNFWNTYSMMAVNAGAENRDVIDAFLRFLYSKDCQLNNYHASVIVRRDLLEELAVETDEDTYLDEYLAFLDSCMPEVAGVEAIQQILYEEAAPFFEGAKSAEEVAQIIQSRVQLYLDESR